MAIQIFFCSSQGVPTPHPPPYHSPTNLFGLYSPPPTGLGSFGIFGMRDWTPEVGGTSWRDPKGTLRPGMVCPVVKKLCENHLGKPSEGIIKVCRSSCVLRRDTWDSCICIPHSFVKPFCCLGILDGEAHSDTWLVIPTFQAGLQIAFLGALSWPLVNEHRR